MFGRSFHFGLFGRLRFGFVRGRFDGRLPEFQRLPLPMLPVLMLPLLLKLNSGLRLMLIEPWP